MYLFIFLRIISKFSHNFSISSEKLYQMLFPKKKTISLQRIYFKPLIHSTFNIDVCPAEKKAAKSFLQKSYPLIN